MRPGKKPGMRQGVLLFLLAGVMFSCLGIFLSFPQDTASEAPYAPPAWSDEGSNASAPEGSYPLSATEERNNKKAKLPATASMLTLVVLAIASFIGASQGAISSRGLQRGGDRRWLAAGLEGPSSFLGVFRL
jgi:hypothetical protein